MIVDTFLFSEPQEKHLLFLKLKLEYDYVDEFIVQENAYDLKGKYKGVFAHQVLSDPIFDEFRNKVTIISQDIEILPTNTEENTNFSRENWQRQLCTEYLLDKYPKDTKVIVSDTDEMFDFSGDRLERFERFFDSGYRWFSRRRYWYSFRNECKLPNIKIPVMLVDYLHRNKNLLGQVRHFNQEDITYYNYDNPLAFEYSYVFYDWTEIRRKHQTYAHNFLDAEQDVKRGLRLNAWIRSKQRNEPRTPYDFFEFIELTEENSPKYVRDNLKILDTNIVDPNYKENRKNEDCD